MKLWCLLIDVVGDDMSVLKDVTHKCTYTHKCIYVRVTSTSHDSNLCIRVQQNTYEGDSRHMNATATTRHEHIWRYLLETHTNIRVHMCTTNTTWRCNILQHTATHCHTATNCSTLQHVFTFVQGVYDTQHSAATHCNTSCNTLQHVFICVCVCTTYIMMLQTLQLCCSCVAVFCSVLQLYIVCRTHVHIRAAFIYLFFPTQQYEP